MKQTNESGRGAVRFREVASVAIPNEAAYIYATSGEERSVALRSMAASAGARVVEIGEMDGYAFTMNGTTYQLRDQAGLARWVASCEGSPVLLDITGLSHSVWAPLVRALIRARVDASVVYVEPGSYRFRKYQSAAEFFDLSEKIEGIRPIPSFETIAPASGPVYFIPLLGFEGARFQFMLENLDPDPNLVFPVVGVPGFHVEFPSYAFLSNAPHLEAHGIWTRVRFADADCAFALYDTLLRLGSEFPSGARLRLALIGTKPHALGAVLFHLLSGFDTEIVYDHPRRSKGRSEGVGKVLQFSLSGLVLKER